MAKVFDVAIIGGGPAGMNAAIYASRRNMSVVVLEGKIFGGAVAETPKIENWLGEKKISGIELSKKFEEHMRTFPVNVVQERVESIEKQSDANFLVTTVADSHVEAKSVILAMGASFKTIGAPGEKEFSGKGVSYCATCDAPFFKGKKVAVIGGGDSAVKTALYLCEIASEVHVVHRRDEFRAEERLVEELKEFEKEGRVVLHLSRVVSEIKGEKFLKSVVLQDVNSKAKEEVFLDGLFIYIGNIPATVLAKNLGVKVNEKGFVECNEKQATNVDGVFAAGDVTGKGMQIVTAAAQGYAASLSAYSYVRKRT
ncbi:MAG: NAD(P)/FAD-dependent oxidoreductase [Candidatus Micrarchaeia archaeon]